MERLSSKAQRPEAHGRLGPLCLSVGFLLLALAGCGSREDISLNLVRQELKKGNVRRAEQQLRQAKSYPDDLIDVVQSVFSISESNWKSKLESILAKARKTNAAVIQLQERARTEEIDDRAAREMRALNGERDLAFEHLAAWLAQQDPATLASESDRVTEAALLAYKSLDPSTREHVQAVFDAIGPAAYTPLVRALAEEDAMIRAGAVHFLGRLADPKIIAPLRALIGKEQEFIVLYELPIALGQIDHPDSVTALTDMLRLRDDGSYTVGSGQARMVAMKQLRRKLLSQPALLSSTLPVILERLGDDNSYVVERAHATLVSLGSAVIPAVLELVSGGWRTMPLSVVARVNADREKARRIALFSEAASVLIDLREPTTMNDRQRETFLDVLDTALADEDLRATASTSLQSMAGYAVSRLVARLDSDDLRIRVTAAQALGAIGDARALDPLIRRIRNEREAEPLTAMIAATQAMRGREAIPALVEVLESPRGKDPRVQNAALSALGRSSDATRYPEEMKRAVTIIRDLAMSRNTRESVRNAGILALGKIKPDGVTIDLRTLMLNEKAPDTLRKNAAWALGELGAKSMDAIPAMEEILRIRREEQKDFLRRLKKLYGNEDKLNEQWEKLGWEAGYRNFREVKVIASLIRSEIVHSYRKIKGADAADLLADVLKDDQRATVRQAAAYDLGELKLKKAELIEALRKDKVGAVRASAAEALGKIKTEDVVAPLLEAIRKDKYETTRRLAAIGLREAKYDSAVRGLVSILRGEHLDEDEELSPTLFSEVSTALQKDGVMVGDAVLATLDDANPKVRATGLVILGVVGATQATDAAIERLRQDDVAGVREQAAYALGRIKQRRAVPALIERLKNRDEWYRVRTAAAWALGSIRARDAEDALLSALKEPYPGLRAYAATALQNIRAEKARPALIRIAKDRDELETVRTAAIGALGALGGDAAQQALLELLARERGNVRVAVVNALGTAKTTDAVPSLIATLENRGETEALRRAAASALGKIGDQRAAVPLANRLMDPTERKIGFYILDEHYYFWETVNVASRNLRLPARLLSTLEDWDQDSWHTIHFRRTVPYPMGAVQSPRAPEAMNEAFQDADLHVRRAALRAMGVSRDPQFKSLLIDQMTNAKSVEERRDAALALGEFGDRDAIGPLTKALQSDADEAVRKNAAWALGKLGAAEPLAAKLQDENTVVGVKIAILNALEEMGPKAQAALPAVQALRGDARGDVAFFAQTAYAAITSTPLGNIGVDGA